MVRCCLTQCSSQRWLKFDLYPGVFASLSLRLQTLIKQWRAEVLPPPWFPLRFSLIWLEGPETERINLVVLFPCSQVRTMHTISFWQRISCWNGSSERQLPTASPITREWFTQTFATWPFYFTKAFAYVYLARQWRRQVFGRKIAFGSIGSFRLHRGGLGAVCRAVFVVARITDTNLKEGNGLWPWP